MSDVRENREAWEAVASFWHERMGEGNDFVDALIWPLLKQLLPPRRELRILDVGCGNGLYSRRLAKEGARVMGIDYSAGMIAHAAAVTADGAIEYRVLDAADPQALDTLPDGAFDAVVSTMVRSWSKRCVDISNVKGSWSVVCCTRPS